jgi:magnesium-transporting ATPase (P-type)
LKRHFWKTILLSTLLVGILDILAAVVNFYSKTGKDPQIVLKYIASAVVGKQAFSGGATMSALGLLFHFFIAFIWTIFFFWIYPKLKFLSANRILTGILYGIFVWFVMSHLVVPMSKASVGAFDLKQAAIAVLILVGAIGLPLSFIAYKYYKEKMSS